MICRFNVIKIPRLKSILPLIFLAFPVILFALFSEKDSAVPVMRDMGCTLVIDPGHGGIDSGALGADGSRESDINLAIALKLRALAELCGQDNVMTRHDDSTMSDTPNYSEQRDLERRAELVNSKDNSVYISIHQNCFPTGQPSGPLVIYSSHEESEKLGKLTHQNLISTLHPESRRLAEPSLDKNYVLSHVDCPAILIECGFVSNFSDMEKLRSNEHQTALATVIMASFLQYTENSRYI